MRRDLQSLFEGAGIDLRRLEAIVIASVVPPLDDSADDGPRRFLQLTPLFVNHTMTQV